MADEYIGKNSAFTATADAIREKGKSTDPVTWDEETGFASPILAIKGGGDLNFEVVGGTTKPSSPKENTIWVNTSAEITGWAFSVDEPENPTPGMVWIVIADSGSIKLNTIEDNAIEVYIGAARQYVNGAFEPVGVMAYQSGIWVSPRLYIVKDGVLQDVALSKLYSANTISQAVGSVKLNSGGNYVAIFTTTNPIDFTNFKNIHLSVSEGKSYRREEKIPLLCYGKSRPTATNVSSSVSVTNIDAYVQMNTSWEDTLVSCAGEFDLAVDIQDECYVGVTLAGAGQGPGYMYVTDFYIE